MYLHTVGLVTVNRMVQAYPGDVSILDPLLYVLLAAIMMMGYRNTSEAKVYLV
jgi:hypothetical protein